MQQILTRVMKGEMAERILIWHQEVEADGMAELSAEMATGIIKAKLNDVAFFRVKRILHSQLHGEIGFRFSCWRDQVTSALQSVQTTFEIEHQSEMARQQRKTNAARQMLLISRHPWYAQLCMRIHAT